MKRRDFLKAAGVTIAAVAMPGCTSAQQRVVKAKKPNIIYIMLDELGYFELSCMGNKYLETPNIDRMATEGMRFTQALAGAPVCAPTRSVLMTGQHTGHRGCGDRGTTGAPEIHGFDIFFGYYHQVHAHSYFPNYLIRSGEKVPLEGNTGDFYQGKQFAHYLIFDESIKFIRENKDKPFFCYCAWTPPHGRWGIPEDEPSWQLFKDKPWTAKSRMPNDVKVYAAMVNMCDRQIGQIFALLKELKIDDNTIVFVCGDNGGARYFNHFFDSNGDFRGQKGNLYEGGLRIPMIVRWPGRIKAGVVSDHLWYFPDVMPTLAELAEVKPPENIDGISIVPTLLGESAAGRKQSKHEFLYWEYRGQTAVRMGNFKAVEPGQNKPFELYDLRKDIGEQNNIADKHPEILGKMKMYAKQAHTENLKGGWIDQEKGFKGHKFR